MKSLLIVLGLISLAIATPLQPVLAPAIGKGVAQIQPLIEIETYKSLPGFPYLVPVAPVHPEQLPEQNVYELPQPPVFVERFPDTSFVLPESPVFVETQSKDKSDKSDVKPHIPSFVAPEAPIFIGNQPEGKTTSSLL